MCMSTVNAFVLLFCIAWVGPHVVVLCPVLTLTPTVFNVLTPKEELPDLLQV